MTGRTTRGVDRPRTLQRRRPHLLLSPVTGHRPGIGTGCPTSGGAVQTCSPRFSRTNAPPRTRVAIPGVLALARRSITVGSSGYAAVLHRD